MSDPQLTADQRLALIWLKVERVEKHLIEFERERTAFLATKPYRVREKPDAKHVYEACHVTDVPGALAAIAGDAIQNLRSALDHLVSQLVLVGLGVSTTDIESHFPIRNKAGQYESVLRGMKEKGLLRQDAFDLLLDVQAYIGGNCGNFWLLNRLNNIDKHRIILTAGSALRSVNIGALMSRLMREHAREAEAAREAAGEAPWPYAAADIPALNAFFRPADNLRPLKVGDTLFTGGDMDPEKDFAFDIAFNEPEILEGEAVLETLKHLAELVRTIIAQFKPSLA